MKKIAIALFVVTGILLNARSCQRSNQHSTMKQLQRRPTSTSNSSGRIYDPKRNRLLPRTCS